VVKKKEENTTTKKKCLECEKEQRLTEFYKHDSPIYKDNKYPICKTCIKSKLRLDEPMSNVAIESVKDVMLQMNKPFIIDLWISSIEEAKKTGKKDVFGLYKKNVDQNNATGTWKNSEFGSEIKQVINNVKNIDNESEMLTANELEILKEKYGYGYPDSEYLLFEKKYQQLAPSFQLLTTMHEEYFKEYCINKVKETLAKARGDFKEAKEWANMVKDVAEAGKLKPSQMSKADLSAGLEGFGQLARAIEEKHELISLLPKFTQQPKDKVDVVLWLYINYIRDLKGMPEVEYRKIWEFYDKRKEEYEKQELDNVPLVETSDEDV
jgi:hypothetical protein